MFKCLGIVGLSIIFLTSCSVERNLAHKYVHEYKGNGILIVPTYELFKDNLTIGYDTAMHYNSTQLDSIAWAQSYFIKQISDSAFLTTFTNALIDELSLYGYDVYVDGGADAFLSLPDPKWIVQISQLQFSEEHNSFYGQAYGESFSKSEALYKWNKILLDSWIDVNKANTDSQNLLYLNAYMQDDMKSDIETVKKSDNYVQEVFIRDSLDIEDTYLMANLLGKKHAELLFDYFMNTYVCENLPIAVEYRKYFHYNRKSRSLIGYSDERFQVIE